MVNPSRYTVILAGDNSAKILERYNPDTGEWGFPKIGDFWDSINAAHRSGYLGQGKTIAIIDSSFDLEIPRLKSRGKIIEPFFTPDGADKSHGTLVALLASEVAPEASLDLYSVSIDKRKTVKAIQVAGKSGAHIINLSLGIEPHKSWLHKKICSLCHCSALAASNGKAVIAATGNDPGEPMCPAYNEHVHAIGFQVETRAGEQAEFSAVTLPDGQAYKSDFTINHPPGVLGTSFASPLISGAFALLPETADAMQIFNARKTGSIAEMYHGVMRAIAEGYNDMVNPDAQMMEPEEIIEIYWSALNSLPHRHKQPGNELPCITCAIFANALYTNAGLFFSEFGQMDHAEELLSVARWLAPWSPHAASGYGNVLWQKGVKLVKSEGDLKTGLKLFEASRDEFQRAKILNPASNVYDIGLLKVDEWIRYCQQNLEGS